MLRMLLLSLALAGCAGKNLTLPKAVPSFSEAQQQAMLTAMQRASEAQDQTEGKLADLTVAVDAARKAAEAAQDVRQPLVAFAPGPDLTQPNPVTAKRPAVASPARPDPAGSKILDQIGQVSSKVGDVAAQGAEAARTIAYLTAQIEALKNRPQPLPPDPLETQGPLAALSTILSLLAFVLGRLTKKGLPK